MTLHLSKCYFISFSNKTKNKTSFEYNIGGHIIKKVNVVNDLGVYFTSNFIFRCHIETTVREVF